MTDRDLHWLAGWLEGEGSFTFWRGARASKSGRASEHRNFRITAASTDEDVAARAAGLLEVRLQGPYHSGNPRHQPYWKFALGDRKRVLSWCKRLYPLMGKRRQAQIEALFVADVKYPPQPLGRPRAGV